MNVWKPIALCFIGGVAFAAGNIDRAEAAGVCHDQPNMTVALTELRAGRNALEKAEHDKGGWRAAAKIAADTAIKETERGCAFADGK
jgi:hypothetical protein